MSGALSVAVIDDDACDRMFSSRVIRKLRPDARITEFPYASDALEYLGTPGHPRIDLILLDIAMPCLDGFDFLDRFARMPAEIRRNVTVIMMSASIDPGDEVKALSYQEVSGFRSKPLDGEYLRSVLSR